MSRPTCTELLTDYFDGALETETRARFREHVAPCPWCETYIDQLLQTIGTLGRLTPDDLDPVDRDRLMQAFRDWAVESPASRLDRVGH